MCLMALQTLEHLLRNARGSGGADFAEEAEDLVWDIYDQVRALCELHYM